MCVLIIMGFSCSLFQQFLKTYFNSKMERTTTRSLSLGPKFRDQKVFQSLILIRDQIWRPKNTDLSRHCFQRPKIFSVSKSNWIFQPRIYGCYFVRLAQNLVSNRDRGGLTVATFQRPRAFWSLRETGLCGQQILVVNTHKSSHIYHESMRMKIWLWSRFLSPISQILT